MAAIQRDADHCISNNEREFILKALKEGQRIDGRLPFELRPLRLHFALDDSSCTLVLGRTRVMAVVTATLDAPYADRHNEGSLRFNVEFSPMASPAFEPGRPGEDAIEVARLIERGLRESRAVDLEALVVLAGRKVWHLRVDVHVLDQGGGLVGACGLAALAALMAFRRPDVTVGGEDGQTVIVHPPDMREPLPLSMHHLPLPISFAIFEGGELLVVDPSLKEEAAAEGAFTVTQNAFGELCSLQKMDGCGLTPPQLMRCIRLATQKVEELTAQIRRALEAHDVARVQARVRRQPAAAAALHSGPSSRGVTVLRSDQLLMGNGGGTAGSVDAAPAAQSGTALPLDLGQLPNSVRSILQHDAAAEAVKAEDALMLSESSDDDDQEEEVGRDEETAAGNGQVEGVEAAEAAGQQPQPPPQQQQEPSSAIQYQRSQPSTDKQHKKRRPLPLRITKQQQGDELAAIADMIAAAGGGAAGGSMAADLNAAVKRKKKTQRQQ